jgi:exopolyphosphatase/guanosine-5'-triphosphate,3'-diphosphate pyrophosphatase
LVLAGCAILDAVWRVWPSERLRAADRGLREGVLLSLIHKSGNKSKRRRRPKNANKKHDKVEAPDNQRVPASQG